MLRLTDMRSKTGKPRGKRKFTNRRVKRNFNSLSLHGQDPNHYQNSQEMIEKVSQCKFFSLGTQIDQRDLPLSDLTASKLPKAIQTGSTGWQLSFDYQDFGDGEPNRTGTYVIRHNLPGTYTISVTNMTMGASTTVDVNGVSMTRIEVTNILQASVRIDITGPVGDFPTDWDIQFLRASDEAAFDNTSVPSWHATRRFIPEFLARRVAWRPHHERFMKALRTEISDKNTIETFPKVTDRLYRKIYPIEVAIGLCNYVRMGGYFNFPMGATDELIDHWCDLVIAHMDTDLPVIWGHSNEVWNSIYQAVKHHSYTGLSKFGTQGLGKITFDGTTITGDGSVDFRTIFTTPSWVIAIDNPDYPRGGMAYALNGDGVVNENTMTIWSGTDSAFQVPTPGPVDWYHNSPNSNEYKDRGYVVNSTLAMKRVTDKFTAAGQMYRVTRMYESQLAWTGQANALWTVTNYWNDGSFVDPFQYHDAVAINPYFGGGNTFTPKGLNSGNEFKEAMRAAAIAGDYAKFNDYMFKQITGVPIPDVAPANRNLYAFTKVKLAEWQAIAAQHGLELYAYEGGEHMVDGGAFDTNDQDILDAWRQFYDSPEAQQLFEVWRDVQIPYLNGPIMKFQTFGSINTSGAFGMWPDYVTTDQSNDKHLQVLENIRQMPPFWLPENPPVAIPVPDQTWTAGVDPDFSLFDYVSMNAESFGATSAPSGMTVNSSTGAVTGSPVAGSGAYIFTATNGAGTVNITVNITVNP